jgi:hypothetical protein
VIVSDVIQPVQSSAFKIQMTQNALILRETENRMNNKNHFEGDITLPESISSQKR